MFFKRPSLKRGGMPTGIETIAPRKNYNIAGIVSPEMATEYARGQGTNLNKRPFIGGKSIYSKPIGPTRTPFQARFPLFSSATSAMSLPSFSTMATLAAPFIPTGIMAYANRPKTDEALKFMKSAPSGTFDETNLDVGEFYKELAEKNKEGKEISFLDAFLMDPETGTYPKAFGRTEDREKIKEIEQAEKEKAEKFLPNAGPKQVNFDKIAEEVVTNKDIKSKDTQPGGEVIEDSFDSEYDKQMKRLEKYLGTSNRESKGKLALALSDAIGTPGSLADKAAVLNKALLGIAAGRKKDKKEMAKLAFAAATELEKAEIAAGKKSQTEKLIERAQRLEAKDKLTPAETTELRLTKAALGDSKKQANLNQVIAAGKEVRKNIDKYKDQLKIVERSKGEAKTQAESDLTGYKRDILSDIQIMKDLGGVENSTLQTLFGDDLKLFLADGGRVNKAMGGPSETPAEPVATNLSFEQLRTRLPKEITDDIVRLVATSEEALQDFAYIRTQGDVEKFNVKYGVNLVLPQDTA